MHLAAPLFGGEGSTGSGTLLLPVPVRNGGLRGWRLRWSPSGWSQTEVVCHDMRRKKVIPFPPRKAADSRPVTEGHSRITIRVGAQRYTLNIPCQGVALPHEPEEAERVRAIFGLFEETGSVRRTLAEIEGRGWCLKSWKRKRGEFRSGGPFTLNSLRRLLGNILYAGAVRHKGQTYSGEHPAILEPCQWERPAFFPVKLSKYPVESQRTIPHA